MSSIDETRMPAEYREVIDDQVKVFKQQRSITIRNSIPDTSEIPLDDQKHWLRIAGVICVFVDMKGSTQLSAETNDSETAGVYQLFTGTAARLFHAFDAPYVDVRGDGAFALFDEDSPYRALAAAVTFKTFAREVFAAEIKTLTDLEVGSHIGIDQRLVLVRRIGLRRSGGRTDRQNEVWAGKPVNMAAKLASIGDVHQLLVSDRFFNHLDDEHALRTCGCPDDVKRELWEPKDLTEDPRFDFDTAYVLDSQWCKTHGDEYCRTILSLDK